MTMQLDTLEQPERADRIQSAVMAAVQKCLGPFAVPPAFETRFSDLGAHSLDLVAIAFELEDEFEIEIHQRSLEDFETLAHAVEVVRELIAERSARA
jgi:acyl carrier protein